MSKAARNRKRREEQAAAREAMLRLLDLLAGVETPERFSEVVGQEPAFLSDAVRAELHRFARVDGSKAVRRLVTLLEDARRDPLTAFAEFVTETESVATGEEAIADAIESLDVAYEQGRFDEVLDQALALLPTAQAAENSDAVSYLHRQRGLAFFNRETDDRGSDLDRAVEELDLALTATRDPEQTADLLMHAGLVIGERVRGDPAENRESSVERLRAALELVRSATHPELVAMIRTNLARALMRREYGDRVGNLSEAKRLCEAALEYRSPERDAVDWAHTQGNLGDVLLDLAELGEASVEEAVEAYGRVIAEAGRIDAQWLVGVAHYSLGRLHAKQAALDAEQLADADDDELEELLDPEPSLRLALKHLEAAVPLTRSAPSRDYHSRALAELASVAGQLGDRPRAITAARAALAIAKPATDPRTCALAAEALGAELLAIEEWEDAANAYRQALAARDLLFHARLDTGAREEEIRRAGNVPRWAAFALAKAGHPIEPARVLELSRTRELRRRLSLEQLDETEISRLPSGLRKAYAAAARALSSVPMGGQGEHQERRFQEVVTAIRAIPGLERFGADTTEIDLAAAESGWPLLFVDPTPAGTLVLALPGEGRQAEASFLAEPTSTEIILRLLLGDAAEDSAADTEVAGSFIFGLVSESPVDRFRAGLDELLPWLGEALARPVRDVLEGLQADGVTLVLCGPLSATPFHAATWVENGRDRCLLDYYNVRYAASAALMATALRRARERDGSRPRLLALADPAKNLAAAGPEVDEISKLFGCEVIRADGHKATLGFLRRHGRSATHVHLACHARGGLLSSADAGVQLADGLVSAADLTRIPGLKARLVAVSACESAVAEMAGLPDEVFSIGTATLAAGSACAIATLWSVDDLAAALLMTRLYEEMLSGTRRPPEALRLAQNWLRELTEEDERAFLAAHPALDLEFRRRAATGDRPGRRTNRRTAGPRFDRRWYAHPDYWAPFVAIGA